MRDVSMAARYSNLILFVGIVFLTSSLNGLSYWFLKVIALSFLRHGKILDLEFESPGSDRL